MSEEFEKWMVERWQNNADISPLAAWQASRKQALIEAEEKIVNIAAKGTVFVGGVIAADACLEAIRALQKT